MVCSVEFLVVCWRICTGFKGVSLRETHLWEHFGRRDQIALITCLKKSNVSDASLNVNKIVTGLSRDFLGDFACVFFPPQKEWPKKKTLGTHPVPGQSRKFVYVYVFFLSLKSRACHVWRKKASLQNGRAKYIPRRNCSAANASEFNVNLFLAIRSPLADHFLGMTDT